MSDLWSIEVVNRGERWIDLRVTQRHPDAGAMPVDKQFVLSLLLDEAYGHDEKWRRIATSPLGEQFPVEAYWDAEVVMARQDEFIESVRLYRQVNAPFHEEAAHAAVDERVLRKNIPRDSDDWESAWENEWRAYWSDPARVPSATYRISVTAPKWIDHIEPGMRFDSASWCPNGPWVNKPRTKTLETPPDAWVKPWLVDFPLSDKPRGTRQMDPQLIESLAASGTPLKGQELATAVAQHKLFLDAGNREGDWQLLSVSGLPLCIYQVYGQSDENKVGAQLVLRMKQIPAGESLRGADIGYADLSGSICRGVDFGKAILDGCAAVDAFFDGATFDGASLRKVDFSGSSLRGCSFVGADLRGADFEHTDLTGADFGAANLTGARMSKVSAANTDFKGAKFIGTDLESARLMRSDFSGALFEGTSLEMARMNHAWFVGTRFIANDFQETKFVATNMQNAFFDGNHTLYTIFTESNLDGCQGCPPDWR